MSRRDVQQIIFWSPITRYSWLARSLVEPSSEVAPRVGESRQLLRVFFPDSCCEWVTFMAILFKLRTSLMWHMKPCVSLIDKYVPCACLHQSA